jgi:hypothetical protein
MKTVARKNFSEADFLDKKEELKKEYGTNKKFGKGYELPALLALTGYPELKDVAIEFVFVNANTPFSSKPKPIDVLKSPADRTYQVNICKEIKQGREDILPRNLDLNKLVGLIAHEFAHIIDYLGKNPAQTIYTGIAYPLPPYKKSLERKIDSITIQRGFGHQLNAFAELIEQLQVQHPDDQYYKSYFDYYLSPSEIQQRISRDKVYQ